MDQIMGRGQGLDSIKVRRIELLNILTDNKRIHIEEFNEAYEGFIRTSILELLSALKQARKRNIPPYLKFDKPVSHEEEYETVIGMLDMSVDEELYITKDQYKAYVQDNWTWKNAFNITNSKYLSK